MGNKCLPMCVFVLVCVHARNTAAVKVYVRHYYIDAIA